MHLSRLKPFGRVVFVGDTHGDFQATHYVINKYLEPKTRIVFLGDYVDRGSHSLKNARYILGLRHFHSRQVFALQGNHENYTNLKYDKADFWESLTEYDKERFSQAFSELPIALSLGSILAVHGAPPDVTNLEKVRQINLQSDNWQAMLWGDLTEENFNREVIYGRDGEPRWTFTRKYFERVMQRLKKKVLIRSHEPSSPLSMFEGRCITLFTSNTIPIYRQKRTIAIADFDKHPEISSIDDLVIEEF